MTPYGGIKLLNFVSGNSLLHDGAKPLPELMLAWHRLCIVVLTWRQFAQDTFEISLLNISLSMAYFRYYRLIAWVEPRTRWSWSEALRLSNRATIDADTLTFTAILTPEAASAASRFPLCHHSNISAIMKWYRGCCICKVDYWMMIAKHVQF